MLKDRLLNSYERNKGYYNVFFITVCAALVMFTPFLIYSQGYFLFFGDFNVQQIPFYKLAHDAVRSGNIFWSFTTDLGANFIGSYSFYLLGSPFFWLTLPFPSEAVPYLMAPLLMLKFAFAGVTGYAYVKRFVRNNDLAVLGGFLYAFSGFSVYNIIFNNFHEPIVFFPLLLVAVEELVQNDRRGVFAFAVFINLLVNYFFFVGEAVFLIIYIIIRMQTGKDFDLKPKTFFLFIAEGLMGVLMTMFLSLPSLIVVMANPRTNSIINGINAVVYNNVQRVPSIIQSFFFPPDIPSRPNFFSDNGSKWASLAGWLPFIGMGGVIAFLQRTRHRHAFVKRIIWTSIVFAVIPILNSTFFAFNSAFYGRWYYMPILFMALASVIAMEDRTVNLTRGLKWNAVVVIGFTVLIGLMPVKNGENWDIGLAPNPERLWIYAAIALASVFICYFITARFKSKPQYLKYMTVGIVVTAVVYSACYITFGKMHSYNDAWIIRTGIRGGENITIPKDEFYRVDVFNGMDNQAMFWGMPNIQAFHSIVPKSVMEFYPYVGVERGVGSRPEPDKYALRSLLSVKYLFAQTDRTDRPSMPGFEQFANQNEFDIYENQYFIPMGFTYDYYITSDIMNKVSTDERSKMMLKGILLEDEQQIVRHSDILTPLPDGYALSVADYADDCADRRNQSARSFTTDNRGFISEITLDRENLVFFSVPYDDGFTATVNGEPAEIELVNKGFMAVRCKAGDNVIRFTYMTPGLINGIWLSLAALAVFILYLLIMRRFDRKPHVMVTAEAPGLPPEQEEGNPEQTPPPEDSHE